MAIDDLNKNAAGFEGGGVFLVVSTEFRTVTRR